MNHLKNETEELPDFKSAKRVLSVNFHQKKSNQSGPNPDYHRNLSSYGKSAAHSPLNKNALAGYEKPDSSNKVSSNDLHKAIVKKEVDQEEVVSRGQQE